MQVPSLWAKHAYPSTATLATWLADLRSRMDFIGSWLYDGAPKVFWLPGLFLPQKFMASVLQRRSRTLEVAVDSLSVKASATQWDTPAQVPEVRHCLTLCLPVLPHLLHPRDLPADPATPT
jgi:dynein heavy chain, axonemal